MKAFYYYLLIHISLVLFLINQANSQTNKNVNYQIIWDDYTIETNDDHCVAFGSEAVNDRHTSGCAIGDEWRSSMSHRENSSGGYSTTVKSNNGINTTFQVYYPGQTLKNVNNVDVSHINFIFSAWEDDHDNTTYSSGDDFYDAHSQNVNFTTGGFSDVTPCTRHEQSFSLSASGNQAKTYVAWRYHNGNDFNNPLTFGEILQGNTVASFNKADDAPSGIDSDMGYSNNYDSGNVPGTNLTNRPDVCYTFDVLGSCKRYTIRNNESGSDVDFWLGKMSGTTFTYIGKIENTSSGEEFYLDAGTYGVIAEGPFLGNYEFELFITRSEVASPSPGSISLNGPSAIEVNTDHPGSINSSSGASNHLSYQWKRRTANSGSSFNNVPGNGSGASYTLGVLDASYYYARFAINGCGVEQSTNEILIQALPANGNVEGHVYTPSGDGVQDITVTLTNLEDIEGGPAANTLTLSDVTDGQGKFDIQGFYVGPNQTDWKLTPNYPNHVFNPSDRTFELGHSDPEELGLTFTDETSFSFSGKVKYNFEGTTCGLPGASIKLNGVHREYTDANGDYNISIPQIGSHTVSVEYANHSFTQPSITQYIDEDKTNQDFTATTLRNVQVNVLTGCGKYAGTANVQFRDSSNCFTKSYWTSVSGILNKQLPAKTYEILITGFNPVTTDPLFSETAVVAFFDAMDIRIDLSYQDTVLDLVFHPEPQLEVLNIPSPPSCSYPVPVVEQYSTFPLTIKLWDFLPGVLSLNDNGCRLDTGSLLINDYVGSPDDNPIVNNYELDNQDFTYLLSPGSPSLASPYTKELQIIGADIDGRTTTFTIDMLIEGLRAREQTFTTVSPQVPLFILRDPPGDLSFSEIIQSTTTERAFSMSTSYGGSFKAWAQNVMEIEGPDGSNSKGWGNIGGSIEVGRQNTSSTESVTTLNFTQTFSTSEDQDPNAIFEEGDVYVGSAFNIIYGISDIIKFDYNRCEVKKDKKLMINPDTFNTTYVYTHNFIRNEVIPNLRNILAAGVSDPDSAQFYRDQAAIWEQTLQRNIDLKRDANYSTNYSFNGGAGAINETHTSSETSTTSFEWTANLDIEIAGELGLILGGTGAAGGFETHFRLDWGEASSTTTTTETTTSFTLDDDNADDAFFVSVGKDKAYATPVFKVNAAETACPYLPGTLKRFDAALNVDQSLHTNVGPNDDVVLVFTITNLSQSEDDLYYVMSFNNASNPDGALIDGSPNPGFNWSFSDPIPYNGSVQQTVTIERGSGNVFAYEGLEFRVYPSCNEVNGDLVNPVASQKVSIYYNTPCTDVTIASPSQNWISSTSNGKLLHLHITDYVKSNMDALAIQYSPTGKSNWNQAISIPVSSLPNNFNIGLMTDWNTTHVPDGNYDIRAKITCGSDIIYTGRTTGIIDQNYPILYGRPTPSDHAITSETETISMKFNENINCNSLTDANVSLTNILTGLDVDISIICSGPDLLIEPNMNLLNLNPAPYRLVVSDIEDLYGNVNQEDLILEFTVGDYTEFTCDESTIFYVDQSAIYGRRTGTTWEDAYVDLRQALENACPGSSIYVAEGSYHPWDSIRTLGVLGDTIVNLDTVSTDDIHYVFTHGYKIYGGFPSGGSDFFNRNPNLYVTKLNGDKNNNNIPDAGDSHTIGFVANDVELFMDGFTFEFAYADGFDGPERYGAGIINRGNPELVNCIFHDLIAQSSTPNNGVGGAYINFSDTTTISNSLFYKNGATAGGGAISCEGGRTNLTNCTFVNNYASHGAGIHIWAGDLYAQNCIFALNTASSNAHINKGGLGVANVNYCLFDDALPALIVGSNNIASTNPEFVMVANDDYNLQSTSTAIDAGFNDYVDVEGLIELNHNYRLMDNSFSAVPTVDLGAYEFSPCDAYSSATSIKVDINAPANQNGSSWNQAISSLTNALVISKACHIDSIFIAEGTYIPDVSFFSHVRDARFILEDDMKLFGGFPTGGDVFENRDWNVYPTILSGDIGTIGLSTDNSYTVVDMSDVDAGSRVDGLIIEQAFSEISSSNTHADLGGGIFISGQGVNKLIEPTVVNCVIRNNHATSGGGIGILSQNSAVIKSQIENCEIINNSSVSSGGGIAEFATGQFTLVNTRIVNTLIANNESMNDGGGIFGQGFVEGQVSSKLINVTLADNQADSDDNGSGTGGGLNLTSLSSGYANYDIINSIFWGNMTGTSVNEVHHNVGESTSKISASIIRDSSENNVLQLADNMTDGGGNTDNNPNYLDANNQNYRLKYQSVGIGLGKNFENQLPTDLVGANRIIGDNIDAGAYEFDFDFPCGIYSTLNITDNPIFGATYKAIGAINSNGKVTNESDGAVKFRSETEITLQPEFEVLLGETFEAKIESPCLD